MTIDPSTLAPDTPVMDGYGSAWSAKQAAASDIPVVRVGEWLPTDEQEAPRSEWATITPGSRVRIEGAAGSILTGTATVAPTNHGGSEFVMNGEIIRPFHRLARVWVLDEPDPDADLIERMAKAMCEGTGSTFANLADEDKQDFRECARAALAVVREDGAR